MDKQIGCCGITCSECPAFQATQENDNNKMAEVAKLWSKEFHAEIKPEDINCDGCLSESGRLCSHCYVCEIRKCCMERQLKNCAHCDDYPCKKLNEFFSMVPEAKATLDEIKKSLTA